MSVSLAHMIPLSERVLRDKAGNPRSCVLCGTRLATVQVEYTLWDCFLCDDCAAEREKRVAVLNALPEPEYRCASCNEPADLAVGVPDEDFWVTGCCGDLFIDAKGNEYTGDYRWRYAE